MLGIKNGIIEGARQVKSPNFNARPDLKEISLLVIHCISLPEGEYGSSNVEDFFTNKLVTSKHPSFSSIEGVMVSAHLFIDRLGNITQFVSLNDRAWHAGVSSFAGVGNCNDYAIGIELEGTDKDNYTEEQYNALGRVTSLIMQAYPAITKDRITSHSAIAPGRKTDPGAGFNWDKYLELW